MQHDSWIYLPISAQSQEQQQSNQTIIYIKLYCFILLYIFISIKLQAYCKLTRYEFVLMYFLLQDYNQAYACLEFHLPKCRSRVSLIYYISQLSSILLNFDQRIAFSKHFFFGPQPNFSSCLCWNRPISQQEFLAWSFPQQIQDSFGKKKLLYELLFFFILQAFGRNFGVPWS